MAKRIKKRTKERTRVVKTHVLAEREDGSEATLCGLGDTENACDLDAFLSLAATARCARCTRMVEETHADADADADADDHMAPSRLGRLLYPADTGKRNVEQITDIMSAICSAVEEKAEQLGDDPNWERLGYFLLLAAVCRRRSRALVYAARAGKGSTADANASTCKKACAKIERLACRLMGDTATAS